MLTPSTERRFKSCRCRKSSFFFSFARESILLGIIKDDVAWSPCLGRGVLDSRAGGAVELCTPFAKRNIPGRVLEGGKKNKPKT